MSADGISRRRMMQGVGVLTATGVIGSTGTARADRDASALATSSTGGDSTAREQPIWSQRGGTAAKAGYRSGAVGPKSGVTVQWSIASQSRISGCAVAGGRVFASDGNTLRAVSAADGSQLWEVETDRTRGTASCPAVANGSVYIGEQDAVVARDVSTGRESWRFEPERETAGFSAPSVTDGTLAVIGRNLGAGTAGRLYILDSRSGGLQWTRETGTSGISSYEAPPVAIENGVIYLASDELVALEATSGTERWSIDPPVTYRALGTNSPAVADGRIYVGCGGGSGTFEARDRTDGSVVWSYTVPPAERETDARGFWTGCAVGSETIYVGFNEHARTERRGHVYAFSADNGSIRWHRTVNCVYTPAIVGALYTGATALDPTDGSVLWRLQTDETSSRLSAPAVGDRTIYVGGSKLRALSRPH